MVTWQPVDVAPVANVHVTVTLPFTSITEEVAGWRPVVSNGTYMHLVIDIAWKGVLYGLYNHEPEGQSPEGEWLYKPYSTNLPCYMCYISALSCRARAKM